MWNDELCSLLIPTWRSGPPCCCQGLWYPCRGPFCGFDPCALQSSICFTQVSLDASGSILAYVPGKYSYLKVPPAPSTNLTFNVRVFRKGVGDSSVDEHKQWEFSDIESNAVQPPAAQAIQTNDSRCSQALASHRWSYQAFQARVEVSQPNVTHTHTWPSRIVETHVIQPRWAACHPGSQCPDHSVPWHPGAQATQAFTAEIRAASPQHPA
ncbi:hypothetical protein HPB52_020364 [Rhipicephalus sanguineus]|uniref:Uncharacterized protein n=1 Tax=Rhipicephalus sanguineus TaxID=34632 RepID=A0A9D4YQM6_RHISA|nr:hypothetical protein HPB52_020364 [Rhipicephalus sanguineus]